MSDKQYGLKEGLLGTVLQTLPGKLASHWLIQSMTYMDPTERTFKLALDAALALGLTAVLVIVGLHVALAATAAFLVAHSLNFLFNGHLRGALKWHGVGGVARPVLEAELVRIARRLTDNPAIKQGFVYGSLSRGELHDGSDLDIRVIREPGIRAAIGSCTAVLLERTRSLASGVPLDVYVWDSTASLGRMRSDERPVDLREIAGGQGHKVGTPERGRGVASQKARVPMLKRALLTTRSRLGLALLLLVGLGLLIGLAEKLAGLVNPLFGRAAETPQASSWSSSWESSVRDAVRRP